MTLTLTLTMAMGMVLSLTVAEGDRPPHSSGGSQIEPFTMTLTMTLMWSRH